MRLPFKEKWQQFNKKQKITVFLTFCLILIGWAFFFGRPRQVPEQPQPPSFKQKVIENILQFFGKKPIFEKPQVLPTPSPTFPSFEQIMKENLDYIESQYRTDGFYNYLAHYNQQCEQKEGETVCPFEGKEMFETTNAWTALAFLGGYQALNQEKYLNLLKRDLDKLISFCQGKPEECLWVLAQVAKVYETTSDSRYLEFLKTEGELLLVHSNPKPLLLDIETRELALLYGLTGDNRYLEEAKKRLKLSQETFSQRELLYQVDQFSFSQKACWQTLAKVELSKQSGETGYFQEVKDFLVKAKININFSQFPHPIEIQPCIETYFELAKVSGEQEYYQEGKMLLKRFVEVFWDSKEVALIYGEGGTIFNPYPDRLHYSQKYVILTDSAYSAYLLGYFKESRKK